MPIKRFCILCAVEHLEEVRKTSGSRADLRIPCSPTGTGEPTHMVCFIPAIEEQRNKYLAKQNLTIMEYENPLEFLAKWNLKIIE